MTKTKTAAPVVATAPAQQSQDLFAMFQAFMQAQGQPAQANPLTNLPGFMGTEKGASAVKSAPKGKTTKKAPAPAKGVEIHMAAKSFFVSGDAAPAKLAAFFVRKPHLDRGFKERTALNGQKAYWFGGRQLEKIKAELAK